MDPLKFTETIIKLLNDAIKAKELKKKERFEKIFVPIHTNLLPIQEYYTKLYLKTSRILIKGEPQAEKRALDLMNKVNDSFDGNLRDIIKAQSLAMINACTTREEKVYIYSIIRYLLEQHGHGSDFDDHILNDVERVKHFLGFIEMNPSIDQAKVIDIIDNQFATPKRRLFRLLSSEDSIENKIQSVTDNIIFLQQYGQLTHIRYQDLLLSVYG